VTHKGATSHQAVITFYESWAREFEQRFPGVKVIMKAAQTPPASPKGTN
jgi:ABC-type phosphate transport system substrate-binding protein